MFFHSDFETEHNNEPLPSLDFMKISNVDSPEYIVPDQPHKFIKRSFVRTDKRTNFGRTKKIVSKLPIPVIHIPKQQTIKPKKVINKKSIKKKNPFEHLVLNKEPLQPRKSKQRASLFLSNVTKNINEEEDNDFNMTSHDDDYKDDKHDSTYFPTPEQHDSPGTLFYPTPELPNIEELSYVLPLDFHDKEKDKSSFKHFKLKPCKHCSAPKFKEQAAGDCCADGKYIPPNSPTLPDELKEVYDTKAFNSNSRKLNYMTSFTTIGTSPTKNQGGDGLHYKNGPSNIILHGKTYHVFYPLKKQQIRKGNGNFLHYVINDPELRNIEQSIDDPVVKDQYNKITSVLDEMNALTKEFKSVFKDRKHLYDTNKEMYLCWKCDDKRSPQVGEVSIIFKKDGPEKYLVTFPITDEDKKGKSKAVNIFNRFWECLQFPIFFPQGTPGWGIEGKHKYKSTTNHTMTMRQYYCARIAKEEIFTYGGRLLNEYIVDAFSRIREERLKHISSPHFQNQIYRKYDVEDVTARGATFEKGRIYIPSSVLGSVRNKRVKLGNALQIVYNFGNPSLFLTMTTNKSWLEVKENVRKYKKPEKLWKDPNVPEYYYQEALDRPDITSVVFKLKFYRLLKLIRSGAVFGSPSIYIIAVIEFQKRGYPHCHLLIRLKGRQPRTTNDINRIISAKLPSQDADPELRKIVKGFMIHNHVLTHCGKKRGDQRGFCKRGYPKPLCTSTHIDPVTGYCVYERLEYEDRWVVPYNPVLLKIFNVHFNIEIANCKNPSYLFKYLHKGSDRAKVMMVDHLKTNDDMTDDKEKEDVDETKAYLDGEYVSASEGMWRIKKYKIYTLEPSCKTLSIHLRHNQTVVYPATQDIPSEAVLKKFQASASPLIRYFGRPSDRDEFENVKFLEYHSKYRVTPRTGINKELLKKLDATTLKDPITGNILIPEDVSKVPGLWLDDCSKFGKDIPKNYVFKRQDCNQLFCRFNTLYVSAGERFYLMILLKHTAARSWEQLKYLDPTNMLTSEKFDSFSEAAIKRNLFTDHTEYFYSMKEAVDLQYTPSHIRNLYILLIQVEGCPAQFLYKEFFTAMVKDWEINDRKNSKFDIKDPTTVTPHSKRKLLLFIQQQLRKNGRKMADYGFEAIPEQLGAVENELNKFNPAEQKQLYEKNIKTCNKEQMEFVRTIVTAVRLEKPLLVYLKAKAGRGKTFAIQTAAALLRSEGYLCILAASTGNTSAEFECGKTAHKSYSIPFNNERKPKVICNPIGKNKELLKNASFCVWDEITQAHRKNVNAVHYMLGQISDKNSSSLCGGKVFVMCGDNQQTAPIVKRGSRFDIVNASFISDPIIVHKMKLKHFFRPQRDKNDLTYSQLCDAVGCGDSSLEVPDHPVIRTRRNPNIITPTDEDDGARVVELPLTSTTDAAAALNWIHNDVNDVISCSENSILCPLNETVDKFNNHFVDKLEGESVIKLATERCKRDDLTTTNEERSSGDLTEKDLDSNLNYSYLPYGVNKEFLSNFHQTGVPPHALEIKKNMLMMVTRNLYPEHQILNGTKVIVDRICNKFIEVRKVSTLKKLRDVAINQNQLEQQMQDNDELQIKDDNIMHDDTYLTQDELQSFLIPKVKFDLEIFDTPIGIYRHQYPLRAAYALTINKSQGKTLNRVLLDLTHPCFSHGQLYVAMTRTSSFNNIRVLLPEHTDENSSSYINPANGKLRTINVIYQELLLSNQQSLTPPERIPDNLVVKGYLKHYLIKKKITTLDCDSALKQVNLMFCLDEQLSMDKFRSIITNLSSFTISDDNLLVYEGKFDNENDVIMDNSTTSQNRDSPNQIFTPPNDDHDNEEEEEIQFFRPSTSNPNILLPLQQDNNDSEMTDNSADDDDGSFYDPIVRHNFVSIVNEIFVTHHEQISEHELDVDYVLSMINTHPLKPHISKQLDLQMLNQLLNEYSNLQDYFVYDNKIMVLDDTVTYEEDFGEETPIDEDGDFRI